jgi:hypothetical protein
MGCGKVQLLLQPLQSAPGGVEGIFDPPEVEIRRLTRGSWAGPSPVALPGQLR